MPFNSNLQAVTESGLYKNITASTLIKTGAGVVLGVIINSHTSGTLRLSDAVTSTTPNITGTITFAADGTYDRFIPLFGARFVTGLYATVGGTANITIVYN